MLLLTSTSDKVQLITGAAASIDVHASYVDKSTGTITPGRTNTVNINTATTTDIVNSPGASTQRNVRAIQITNTHATQDCTVTVVHTDGTNVADLIGVVLKPGENLGYREDGSWVHRDWNGAEYTATSPIDPWACTSISGVQAESIPRMLCNEANLSALTSGTLFFQAIYLRAGQKISSVSVSSATTAAGTPTNQRFGLYDSARNKLAETSDALTAAWAANTVKTLSLTSQYTITQSGLYYIGVLVAATTVPTIKGLTAKTSGSLAAQAPILHGNTASTGLTTSIPSTAGAVTGGTSCIWVAVS